MANNKLIPIVEIFGPVIQGEGPQMGLPTNFVRVGGCDSHCSWCDTKYAVNIEKGGCLSLSTQNLLDQLRHALKKVNHVTLTGGNPCLYDLMNLVTTLRGGNVFVALETQGTIWQSWVSVCDLVVLSPKPPSSGMEFNEAKFERFLTGCRSCATKVVVFDQADYEFAKRIYNLVNGKDFYLQIGTPLAPEQSTEEVRNAILDATATLIGNSAKLHWEMPTAKILPQLHVLLYGHRRGI